MRISPANKSIKIFTCGVLVCLSAFIFIEAASAYWIWTPETKKFVNPKYAVKDSPKEQFDWAMNFYNAKDYKRAASEFEKLTKHYEFSQYASTAQYYAGLSYEAMGKYYIAFQAYQKTVDNFPHAENLDEIIAKEFRIASLYAEKPNPKVLGADIMTSTDRSIEMYRKVVENAPFGPLADEALYRMGETMKRASLFEEATLTFQKIIDEYPTSKFADKAQYEVAQCAYKASLQPAYDAGPTDRALRIFEEYAASGRDEKLSEEAKRTMQRLKNKAAEKSMIVAKFYEQANHPKSAIIYYQDVLDRYPESIYAPLAKAKITLLELAPVPSEGIMGWFGKPAAEEAAPAPKKKWQPLSLFGKKEKPSALEAAPAIGAPQAPAAPGVTAGVPIAAITPAVAMPQAPAAPVSPAKKAWDFLGLWPSTTPKPPPAAPPVPASPDAPAVAYEEKGVDRASPRLDDPNVEVQDDII